MCCLTFTTNLNLSSLVTVSHTNDKFGNRLEGRSAAQGCHEQAARTHTDHLQEVPALPAGLPAARHPPFPFSLPDLPLSGATAARGVCAARWAWPRPLTSSHCSSNSSAPQSSFPRCPPARPTGPPRSPAQPPLQVTTARQWATGRRVEPAAAAARRNGGGDGSGRRAAADRPRAR
jgi:hypothetical protein